jgi:hypothetical protein
VATPHGDELSSVEHFLEILQQHDGVAFIVVGFGERSGSVTRPDRPVAADGLRDGQQRFPIIAAAIGQLLGDHRFGLSESVKMVISPSRDL